MKAAANRGGRMRRTMALKVLPAVGAGLLVALAVPGLASGNYTAGITGFVGGTGFLLQGFGDPTTAFPVMGLSNATVESKFFFQFVFCAVSLAIVWGTTLERIKFGVYIIYAVVFSAFIYPIGAHWVFGGGFLQAGDWLRPRIVGVQDLAGP